MVTGPRASAGPESGACRRLVERLLDDPAAGAAAEALAPFSAETLEAALKTLLPRGAELLPILVGLEDSHKKALRRVAKRTRYRLQSAGVALPKQSLPPSPPAAAWRLTEAWASPIDGTGSRAFWLVAEGPYGQWLRLSVVLNDQVGILDATGGPITKKRIAEEFQHLKTHGELRWISLSPDYTRGLIAEAAGVQGDEPPPKDFLRWQSFLVGLPISRPLILENLDPEGIRADPTLLDHSAELLAQPELAGWFLDPDVVLSAALEREEARASRLVLSDAQKADREASIVARTADERFTEAERNRWRRRLEETAHLFWQTERRREASLALAAALALGDSGRSPRHQPFCLAVARRSLDVAAEVQGGKLKADAVRRRPHRPTRSGSQKS